MNQIESTQIESILIEILSELRLLRESLSSDQIRSSNQSNQSDLIRSDQILKKRSNWKDIFTADCLFYGVDPELIDFTAAESGAVYYVENRSKIRAKKSYLAKIASNNVISRQGDPASKIQYNQEDTSCLGFQCDYLDTFHSKITPDLIKSLVAKKPLYSSMFTNLELVKNSTMKSRVLIALCLQEGIISA